jgi:spore maturation protein CgeB
VTSWLQTNLTVLAGRDPALAAVVGAAGRGAVAASVAADGTGNLSIGGIPLHNTHAPAVEARRWAREQLEAPGRAEAETLVVLGFGAAHHLEALAARWPKRLVVVEPSLALLRAALELADLRDLLGRIEIAREAPADTALDALGRAVVIAFAPALASDRAAFRTIRRALQGALGRRWLRLKILVVSPLEGGTLPITEYCARALAGLGHRVTVCDASPFAAGFRGLAGFRARAPDRGRLESRYLELVADGVLARVEHEQPDLVLAMAQAPLTAAALQALAARDVPTALWFVEDFRRFPYWQDVGPHYRYVFSIQRDDCLAAFAAAGIARTHYLPCAADPAVHRPLALDPAEQTAFGSAVSFVGAGYRNRRVAFRHLADLDLRIWGSEWAGADGVWPLVQRQGARISSADGVRIFNASAINLNLHSSTYVDGVDPRGDFVNPRTFELAACGAFQLVDERRLLPELFVPGVEVATFASVPELRDRIAHYLAHPEERAAIAAAGRRRVLAEHTYAARMGELLEVVFGLDYDRFLASTAGGDGAAAMVAAAGADTPLGVYLRTCGDAPELTLADLTSRIQLGQGPLGEAEELLLFLKHFDDMFLTEHRQ